MVYISIFILEFCIISSFHYILIFFNYAYAFCKSMSAWFFYILITFSDGSMFFCATDHVGWILFSVDPHGLALISHFQSCISA